MKVVAFVLALLFIGVSVDARPPEATDFQTGPDDATLMLTVGAVGISFANILCMTLGDGSTLAGIAGVVVGATLIPWSLTTDSLDYDDRTPYVGIGIGAIAFGACDYLCAKRGRDTELLGFQFDPSIRSFDCQRWYGFQFTSSW